MVVSLMVDSIYLLQIIYMHAVDIKDLNFDFKLLIKYKSFYVLYVDRLVCIAYKIYKNIRF